MSDVTADDGVLHDEHGRLGARFSGDDRAIPVLSYAGVVTSEARALAETGSAGLCDLSGMFVQLIEGSAAADYAAAVCAAPLPEPGCARFGAVLAGDGATIAIPLLMRTGTNECVLLDATARAEILAPWLSFVVGIGHDGAFPFGDVRLTDATGVHVPLMLMGDAAATVLADYLSDLSDLPAEGMVRPLTLDGRLEVICLRVPLDRPGDPARRGPCYVLLVAPTQAGVLWRSLLSFPSVVPVGRQALAATLGSLLPWLSCLDDEDRIMLAPKDLRAWQLLRDTRDYVGSHALWGGHPGELHPDGADHTRGDTP